MYLNSKAHIARLTVTAASSSRALGVWTPLIYITPQLELTARVEYQYQYQNFDIVARLPEQMVMLRVCSRDSGAQLLTMLPKTGP